MMISRAELQQVREFIEQACDYLRPDESSGEGMACALLGKADSILDRALAAPEVREWRVSWQTYVDVLDAWVDDVQPFEPGESARAAAMALVEELRGDKDERDIIAESRVPAGPWEPEGVK